MAAPKMILTRKLSPKMVLTPINKPQPGGIKFTPKARVPYKMVKFTA